MNLSWPYNGLTWSFLGLGDQCKGHPRLLTTPAGLLEALQPAGLPGHHCP